MAALLAACLGRSLHDAPSLDPRNKGNSRTAEGAEGSGHGCARR